MKVTSAVANKMVKKLQSDLDFLYQIQQKRRTYVEVPGQEPIIPDYDFDSVQTEIASLELKIRYIKHAVNKHNVNTELDGFDGLTVDQALIMMSQYNKRLNVLDTMRSQAQKVLDTGSGYSGAKQQVQYTVSNYDPKEAAQEYQSLYKSLQELQVALDTSNSTATFEIPD